MNAIRNLFLTLALITGISPAIAQTFPTVPPGTVIGRMGGGTSGPSQAIPFATLNSNLFNSLCTTSGAFPIYNATSGLWVCSTAGGTGSLGILNGPLSLVLSNPGGSEQAFQAHDATMTAGNGILIALGRDESANDRATFGFRYSALNSANNTGWLGLYASDCILKWDGNGNVGIGLGCSTALTKEFQVGANFSVDSGGNIINAGNITSSGAASSFGPGGTSGGAQQISLLGASGANGGTVFAFEKNATINWYLGDHSTFAGGSVTDWGLFNAAGPGCANAIDVSLSASLVSMCGALTVTGVTTLGNNSVLGTPASVTLTNATGLPVSTGISGLGTGVAAALANALNAASGLVGFNGNIGTTATGHASLDLAISTLGTGIQTALGVAVGSAGAPVINGGALGSPSSAGTIPAFTAGGNINLGGNAITGNSSSVVTAGVVQGPASTNFVLNNQGTFFVFETNAVNTMVMLSSLFEPSNDNSVAFGGTSNRLASVHSVGIFASANGVGYDSAIGVGCSATQITGRTTGVTCQGPTGKITLVSAAGTSTPATFTVTNTSVGADDTVECTQASGANTYRCYAGPITAGTSFKLTQEASVGTATETPAFNFNVIKGSHN